LTSGGLPRGQSIARAATVTSRGCVRSTGCSLASEGTAQGRQGGVSRPVWAVRPAVRMRPIAGGLRASAGRSAARAGVDRGSAGGDRWGWSASTSKRSATAPRHRRPTAGARIRWALHGHQANRAYPSRQVGFPRRDRLCPHGHLIDGDRFASLMIDRVWVSKPCRPLRSLNSTKTTSSNTARGASVPYDPASLGQLSHSLSCRHRG
jgi:hypothetical protein